MQATVKDGERPGRGFSMAELKEAGFDARTARKHGVPTDVWRDTRYDTNVDQLKGIAKSLQEAKKAEKKKAEPPAKRKTTKKSAKKKVTKKKVRKRKK